MNCMILDVLKKHAEREKSSFHMPGHKNGAAFSGSILQNELFALDTTELCDTDALVAPQGAILEAERQAAVSYGAAHSFYLVNGSSGGILAMIYTAFRPGDTVLIDRNCHQSVIHGALLTGIRPVYIVPAASRLPGIPGVLTFESVREALQRFPDCKGLILTSPNYYGAAANLKEIAALIHGVGGVLLVDEAHGAHFPFSDAFPESAMQQGADLSVVSLHKSMPAPNQTALLHSSGRFGAEEVRKNIRIFQTSSPSYIFLASMEQAVAFGNEYGAERTEALLKELHSLQCAALDDPFKLLPDFRQKGLSGVQAEEIFREKFGIYAEMTTENGLLLLASWSTTEADICRLREALDYCRSLPAVLTEIKRPVSVDAVIAPSALPLGELRQRKQYQVELTQSAGKICAVPVSAFPPCIPVLLPGELITEERIEQLRRLQLRGAVITGLADNRVTVC